MSMPDRKEVNRLKRLGKSFVYPSFPAALNTLPTYGYCVKCRARRNMSNPQIVTLKNGRQATQGVCPICGTKMFRINKSR
jgi:hypothetical protein